MRLQTTDTELKQHNGKKLTVLRPLVKQVEYDYEGPETSQEMFEVQLETGETIQVFADEMFEA